MKTKFIFSILALGFFINAFGQRNTLELTFTAINNALNVQLDSIKVMNLNQNNDTILYWPDTVLVLDYQVGIHEINSATGNFQVFQNYPNPVKDQTIISLSVPEEGNVSMMITNTLGQVILKDDRRLEKGTHSFLFTPGSKNLYFFSAQWKGMSSSIKILQTTSNSHGKGSLEYIGSKVSYTHLKAKKDIQNFTFSIGDKLLYIGYSGTLQSGMLDAPEESHTYVFQFATNIPCPGTPTVTYGGQVYHTIQIFSQCWLKENLNIGTMIPGTQEMSNNSVIEKYCFINSSDSCQKYGGLYSWWEMMQYVQEEGTQGICPPGWHIPSDNEWKILEGSTDSQSGIGSVTWDLWGLRGFDSGENLKNDTGWRYGGNGTNLYDFSGLEGGMKWGSSNWFNPGRGYWWSSTESNNSGAWHRILDYSNSGVRRNNDDNSFALSVRCIKD